MPITIITNNHPRPILSGFQITNEEAKDFEYIDWDAVARGEFMPMFVRYKGRLYDLNDTEGPFPPDRRWLYVSDSFFSGVLFRNIEETDEGGSVICGRYYD